MDDLEVKLEPSVGYEEIVTPIGKQRIKHVYNQWLVVVYSEGIKTTPHRFRNPKGKLQVGIIGKQEGAKFSPTSALYEFHPTTQDWIDDEARRLHGSASTERRTDVPPPLPDEDELLEELESDAMNE